MSTLDDLREFLLARLDEDEAAGEADAFPPPGYADADRQARGVRMLAEVEVKRQIMRGHAQPHECIAFTGGGERSVTDGKPWELWEPEHTADHGPCFVLRCLALPYADRPGFKEEWRP